MSLKPMGTNLVCKRLEAPIMVGSIYIPEEYRERQSEARVLSVGPGGYDDETEEDIIMDVFPGDRVTFIPWSGHEVELDGESLLILDIEDVIVAIEEKSPA